MKDKTYRARSAFALPKSPFTIALRKTCLLFSLAVSSASSFAVCTTANLSTFDSTPFHLEAEDFCSMSGVQTGSITSPYSAGPLATFVGWLDAGDSMTYHIKVPDNAPLPLNYKVTFNVAAPNAVARAFEFGNAVGVAAYDVPATGSWQNFTTISQTLQVTKTGEQDIQFKIKSGAFNLDWIEFSAQPTAVAPIQVKGNEILTPTGKKPSFIYGKDTQTEFLSGQKIQRLVIPVEGSDGFIMNPALQKARIQSAVATAVANKAYVIIDWSSSAAHFYQAEALNFFEEVARNYGNLSNVIYEINDKPDAGTSWANQIKPYAQNVIYAIRQIDPDNLIIVGTPNQSQAVEEPAADPLTGTNIAYALSFTLGGNSTSTKMPRNEEANKFRERILTALEANIPFVITDWRYDLGQSAQSSEYREWSYFAGATGIPSIGFDSLYFTQTINFGICYNAFDPRAAHPIGRFIVARYTCTNPFNIYYPTNQFGFYFTESDNVQSDRVILKMRARVSAPTQFGINNQVGTSLFYAAEDTKGQFKTFSMSVPSSLARGDFARFTLFNGTDAEIHWVQREEISTVGKIFAGIVSERTFLWINEAGEGMLTIDAYLPTACDELNLPITPVVQDTDVAVDVTYKPNTAQVCEQIPARYKLDVKIPFGKKVYLNEKFKGVLKAPSSSSVATTSSAPSSSVVPSSSSRSYSSSSLDCSTYLATQDSYCPKSSSSKIPSSTPSSKTSASLVPSSSVAPSSKPVSSSSVAPSSKSSSSISFVKLIEAEQYSAMSGIQTENTTDIGGGRNVGWIDSGDWMSYNNSPIDIPVTGVYDVEFRVASLNNGGNLVFEEAGGSTRYGSASFSATGGWQTWKTVKIQVNLTQGTHRFGIKANSGGWNINWFQIRKAN